MCCSGLNGREMNCEKAVTAEGQSNYSYEAVIAWATVRNYTTAKTNVLHQTHVKNLNEDERKFKKKKKKKKTAKLSFTALAWQDVWEYECTFTNMKYCSVLFQIIYFGCA